VIGGVVAFALAFFGANVIVVFLGSIGVLSIYSILLGFVFEKQIPISDPYE
jgi:hypothetical protein